MKAGFALNSKKVAGKLTKFFTGCYAYHAYWVDEKNGKMYDMNLLRRRREWPHYDTNIEVILFDVPEVTTEFLEHKLDTDTSTYGWKDYLLFSIRPIYHLFGKSTRNVNGIICSEMVNNDMWECGVKTPWKPSDPPPSPCDLLKWFMNRK